MTSKIAWTIVIVVAALFGGYVYFDQVKSTDPVVVVSDSENETAKEVPLVEENKENKGSNASVSSSTAPVQANKEEYKNLEDDAERIYVSAEVKVLLPDSKIGEMKSTGDFVLMTGEQFLKRVPLKFTVIPVEVVHDEFSVSRTSIDVIFFRFEDKNTDFTKFLTEFDPEISAASPKNTFTVGDETIKRYDRTEKDSTGHNTTYIWEHNNMLVLVGPTHLQYESQVKLIFENIIGKK